MTMAHDLLAEALLSWRDTKRRRAMTTLPGLLARLGSGELGDFPKVRSHQFHPWSMFLAQLAAIALRGADKTDPIQSEEGWRDLLLGLTGGEHEPWCLVVSDLAKPAFFQPPVPEAKPGTTYTIENAWKGRARTPDSLDILVTSKSHEVKQELLGAQVPELWVYALVTLQTMQGYPGRGYNPISRMNGGYGNRPRVGLAPDLAPAGRFARDVAVLLDSWEALLKRGFREKGISLLWLEPWDGKASLGLGDLSPHYIEVCWRVRLAVDGDGLSCRFTTTERRRCLAGAIENGDVGDPWIPIEREKGALTIGRRGFDYQILTRLLFGSDYAPAAAQVLRPTDRDPVYFLAAALSRGQGKTDGLHERSLPIAGEVKRRLGRPDERAALGRRASAFVENVRRMRVEILFPALKRLALGENIVKDTFDARADEAFFPELFSTIGDEDPAALLRWQERLASIAHDELQCAIARCCLPDAQRYRAIADAESLFQYCLRKAFPDTVAAREPQNQQPQEGVHP